MIESKSQHYEVVAKAKGLRAKYWNVVICNPYFYAVFEFFLCKFLPRQACFSSFSLYFYCLSFNKITDSFAVDLIWLRVLVFPTWYWILSYLGGLWWSFNDRQWKRSLGSHWTCFMGQKMRRSNISWSVYPCYYVFGLD